MIPLPHGETAPLYQQEAITWLKHFKHTELLQQLLSRFEFSEAEIAAYRNNWSQWLRAIPALRNENQNNHDPCGTATT